MSNADTEQQSRFGDKAADAGSLEAGSVAWRDGTAPVLVVGVNQAGDDDPGAGNSSVQIAALDVETVHVDDLATEFVDPSEQGAAGGPGTTAAPIPAPGAQSVAVVSPQPPADLPSRQTTPTGAPAAGGTAVADAGAAQAAIEGDPSTTNPPPGMGPDATYEQEQADRIADLEARLATAEARANEAEAGAATAPPAPAPPGD